ncbi:MAG: hypothetical protein R3318_02650 [Gammaproteobacteria bacterium]|nr:hypothetical protein [Gammaproteobacteria bacterium]
MKLSVKSFAIAAAILWGLAMLIMNTVNMPSPDYAINFLQAVESVYPGYTQGEGVKSIVVGTLYGIVDAGIAGAIFAWVYNLFAK